MTWWDSSEHNLICLAKRLAKQPRRLLVSSQSKLVDQQKQVVEGSARRGREFERKATSEIVNNEVTKWQSLVKRNREATQLDFRDDQNEQFKNLDNKLESRQFKGMAVVEELGKATGAIEGGQVVDFDKAEGPVAEAVKQELLKNKHLLLYQEMRAKRLKKIKSKLFRRIKKKQRDREHEKTLSMRIGNNKEAVFEEIEKMERKRAEVG